MGAQSEQPIQTKRLFTTPLSSFINTFIQNALEAFMFNTLVVVAIAAAAAVTADGAVEFKERPNIGEM
jgi:uncharacterized membrane protein YebE (DUF533 family)